MHFFFEEGECRQSSARTNCSFPIGCLPVGLVSCLLSDLSFYFRVCNLALHRRWPPSAGGGLSSLFPYIVSAQSYLVK